MSIVVMASAEGCFEDRPWRLLASAPAVHGALGDLARPSRIELRSTGLVDAPMILVDEFCMTKKKVGRRLRKPLALSPDELRERFQAAVRASPIAKHADYALSLLRPRVRLVVSEGCPSTGMSKLGGFPDLPPGAPWPEHRLGPYTFLAQLDFAELTLPVGDLPDRGRLSLFAATRPTEAIFWQDRGYVRAIYTPADMAVDPRTPPPPSPAQLADEHDDVEVAFTNRTGDWDPGRQLAVRLEPTLGLPNGIDQRDDWPGADRYEFHDELLTVWEAASGEDPRYVSDQLLGYPGQATLAYDPTPGPQWLPLVTLRSHDRLGWCWHDGDPLHVFIERERLQDRDFSNLASDAG